MTEAAYQAVIAMGRVAQAAQALLVALQRSTILGPVVGDGACRLCGGPGDHLPGYPCADLVDALEGVSGPMQALVRAKR